MALCSWNFAKHVIATVFFAGWLANTDTNAHEILRLQMLGDRAQAVVAGQPTTNFDAYNTRCQIQFVVHDHDARHFVNAEAPRQRANCLA